MDVSKKYVEKRLIKMFLTEDEDTADQNIRTRSLTLLIFAVAWAHGRPQPEHESMMPLLSLSLLNVLTD